MVKGDSSRYVSGGMATGGRESTGSRGPGVIGGSKRSRCVGKGWGRDEEFCAMTGVPVGPGTGMRDPTARHL